MYKIGMIGERDSVMGFMALGFSVAEAADAKEARRKLEKMREDPEYAVIFLVENYAEELQDEIAKSKDSPLPAIVLIPGRSGATGYGTESIRRAVERAVGVDLFKD